MLTKLFKWLKNHWYYYKIYTITFFILIVIVVFASIQFATKVSYDYNVLLIMSEMATSETENALEVTLKKYGEDLNNDGVVNFQIMNFSYSLTEKNQDVAANSSSALLAELQRAKNYIIISDGMRLEQLMETDVFESADCFNSYDGKALDIRYTCFNSMMMTNLAQEGIEPKIMPEMYITLRKAPDEKNKNYKNFVAAKSVVEKIAADTGE